ncbi:hypothetical protein QE152_g6298 [Popillia japonica]|uniref:Uncharacterized protein n=1 Tax=Popillia japonica TaxID=7064 RepID=A0AAW1MJF0_POPJA
MRATYILVRQPLSHAIIRSPIAPERHHNTEKSVTPRGRLPSPHTTNVRMHVLVAQRGPPFLINECVNLYGMFSAGPIRVGRAIGSQRGPPFLINECVNLYGMFSAGPIRVGRAIG